MVKNGRAGKARAKIWHDMATRIVLHVWAVAAKCEGDGRECRLSDTAPANPGSPGNGYTNPS